jgi:hypothetical protein
LKKAKINPATDEVIELLDAAAFCRKPEVVEYMLSFDPDVNATVEDGEAVLESYFRRLVWDLVRSRLHAERARPINSMY